MKEKTEKSKVENKAKKKTRRLFLSTFIPLITLTLTSCTVFAILMLQVVYAYIKSETSRITGDVSSSLMANFNPDIIVAKNLADFGSAGIDINSMDAVIKTFSSNLNYVTLVYYATENQDLKKVEDL